MCTVTLFAINDTDFVLTSNRDEAPNREALAPDTYDVNGVKMLFPKDKMAGGSWIGVSEKKRVLCVLNGGFELHERQPEYRLSRGVVMKELLACDSIEEAIENYDLNDVEPFTLVIADWSVRLRFFELVWDGTHKHFKELPLKPKIWSSSTLYTKQMKDERLQWFESFKNTHVLDKSSILEFHEHTETQNKEYGVIMDRFFVKTTSITQVAKHDKLIDMRFHDFSNSKISHHQLKSSEILND